MDNFDPTVENDESNVEKNESNFAAAAPSKPVQPKTPIIRRPRNILRAEHLISKRGIVELPEIFKQTNFKGKGYELEDLKLLLFKTKHWAHRLFPGLTFEDFLNKTEQLGNKRIVKNFLNRIRTNQPLHLNNNNDNHIIQSDGSDNEDDNPSTNDNQNANNDNESNVPVMEQASLKFDMIFSNNNNNNSDSNVPSNNSTVDDNGNRQQQKNKDNEDYQFENDDDFYNEDDFDDNIVIEKSKES